MGELLSLDELLAIITVSVAVSTLMWRILTRNSDRRRSEQVRNQTELAKIVKTLQEEIEAVEKERRLGDRRLHERITELENRAHKDIVERLATIEGELKGIKNTSYNMNQWLIDNGAKVTT